MARSPAPDNEMMTSFSNPNYGLTNADALNSNLQGHYNSADDENYMYSELDPLTPDPSMTSTRGFPPSSLDYHPGSEPLLRRDSGHSYADSAIHTPDSEGLLSGASSLLSPDGRDDDDDDDDDLSGDGTYCEVESGFRGYHSQKTAIALEESKKGTVRVDNKRDDSSQDSYDEDKAKDINSPDSNDSGIQADVPHNNTSQQRHVRGPVNDDLYAVPQKTSPVTENGGTGDGESSGNKEVKVTKDEEEGEGEDEDTEEGEEEHLPPGWEKHEDQDGAYFWHIKSGTIQREPPPPLPPEQRQLSALTTSINSQMSQSTCSYDSYTSMETTSDRCLQEFDPHTFKSKPQEEDTETLVDGSSGSDADDKCPIRFAVRSLGWVRIAEEDLTPERSSKAVNKCIVDLSLGRNDINDVVGRWGDGKDLYMDLDDQNLTLIDPQDMSVLNIQPIHSIRVWGVGRDNGRDFAYVARDRLTRKHMCHVFRCDTPARQIANTLRDICKKIMLERSLTTGGATCRMMRPNHLPNLERAGERDGSSGRKITFETLLKTTSFPTPMEEPKKVLRCHYLGTSQVSAPTGVDILNSAMEKVHARVPPEKWVFANVAVAPSTITITEQGKPDNVLAECRVRFLSFMGIAMRNVKLCAFIMHTAQDNYVCHVFHCEPSAGAICKTIEAACKLRYQKCLDAHQQQLPGSRKGQTPQPINKPEDLPLLDLPPPTSPLTPVTNLTASVRAGFSNIVGMIKRKANKS